MKMKILSFLNRLFCRHEYKFYKAFSNQKYIYRKFKCDKCGNKTTFKFDRKIMDDNLFP